MNWHIRNNAIVGIALASIVASLAYSFAYRIPPVVDAQAYDTIAMNLVNGYGFREDPAKPFTHDTAIVRAGPGYEFFLAGIYKVFGHSYAAVWSIQALLHGLTAILLFLICRRVFSESGDTVGLVAAALFGFHPDLIEISAMLMTETLYLFFVVLCAYVFIIATVRPRHLITAALVGIVTGVAILTRPPVLLFVPIVLWMYFRARAYRSIGVFLAGALIALLPWTVRNYLMYHQVILTTLIGEYNLWVGNTLLSTGGQIAGGFNPVIAYGEAHGYAGMAAEAHRQFWQFVFQHPFVFLTLCLLRAIRFFSLIRPMGFWFYQDGIKQLLFVASSLFSILVLFVSGFAGITAVIREKQKYLWYLVAMALSAPLLLIPTVVESRYRFQIYPFLAMFGAYMMVRSWKETWWRNRSVLLAAGFLACVSIMDAIIHVDIVLEHLGRF